MTNNYLHRLKIVTDKANRLFNFSNAKYKIPIYISYQTNQIIDDPKIITILDNLQINEFRYIENNLYYKFKLYNIKRITFDDKEIYDIFKRRTVNNHELELIKESPILKTVEYYNCDYNSIFIEGGNWFKYHLIKVDVSETYFENPKVKLHLQKISVLKDLFKTYYLHYYTKYNNTFYYIYIIKDKLKNIMYLKLIYFNILIQNELIKINNDIDLNYMRFLIKYIYNNNKLNINSIEQINRNTNNIKFNIDMFDIITKFYTKKISYDFFNLILYTLFTGECVSFDED